MLEQYELPERINIVSKVLETIDNHNRAVRLVNLLPEKARVELMPKRASVMEAFADFQKAIHGDGSLYDNTPSSNKTSSKGTRSR